MGAIEQVEKSQMASRPAMKSGDTVRVHVKVREGDKERIQVFEGVVIGLHRGGTRASFTVRKVSFGQGVERIFPLHSPTIQKVEVMRSAKVRRAKLYYLRELKGKAARMRDVGPPRREEPRSGCLGGRSKVPRVHVGDLGTDPSSVARSDGARYRLSHARERAAARRLLRTSRASTKWAAAAWPGPSWPAAVVLHPDRHIPGVCDSKLASSAERERLFQQNSS